MQPEMISLMQQLVTAVQSVALSVDVMSMDLRALNKNVAQLVKRDLNRSISPLTLAPECSYSQDDEASHRATPAPASDHTPGVEGSTTFQSPSNPDDEDLHEKFPAIRDSLREDIKKAMVNPPSLSVPFWQKNSNDSHDIGEGSGWETFRPDAQSVGKNENSGEGQVEALERSLGSEGSGVTPESGAPGVHSDGGRLMNEGETMMHPGPGGPIDHAHGGGQMLHPEDGEAMISPSAMQKKDGTFKCVWCGKIFSDNYKLKRHWRVHTGEKPFPCFQCGKAFAHKENLIVHSRVHSGERPFRCEECGKSFVQMGKLTVHKRIHSGERPFRCDLCGKAFIQKDSLMVHRRVHTGEKPFSCDVCGRGFRDSWKLKRHRQVHIQRLRQGVAP